MKNAKIVYSDGWGAKVIQNVTHMDETNDTVILYRENKTVAYVNRARTLSIELVEVVTE